MREGERGKREKERGREEGREKEGRERGERRRIPSAETLLKYSLLLSGFLMYL